MARPVFSSHRVFQRGGESGTRYDEIPHADLCHTELAECVILGDKGRTGEGGRGQGRDGKLQRSMRAGR